MKEIKAVIQPNRLRRLRQAFRQMRGFPGMTVTRAEGCSGHEEPETAHGIKDELTDFVPVIRIEIVAPDDRVEEIVRIIHAHAYSGRRKDGVLWITEAETTFKRLGEPLDP
jgi:nitrogen regulatory protein P-II 1